MKKKDIADLRNKTKAELTKTAADLNVAINKAQMEMSIRKIKNTNFAKNLKKQLAVILSIKNEH